MPDDIHNEVMGHLKESCFSEREYHSGAVELLEEERKELQGKLDKLMDLLLAEHITPDEHNRKRGQLQNRQIELSELIKKHSEADHSFVIL